MGLSRAHRADAVCRHEPRPGTRRLCRSRPARPAAPLTIRQRSRAVAVAEWQLMRRASAFTPAAAIAHAGSARAALATTNDYSIVTAQFLQVVTIQSRLQDAVPFVPSWTADTAASHGQARGRRSCDQRAFFDWPPQRPGRAQPARTVAAAEVLRGPCARTMDRICIRSSKTNGARQ